MRKTVTLILFMAFSAFVFAQTVNNNTQFIPKSEVPNLVLERQQNLFPNNFVSEWQVQKIDGMQNASAMRYIAKFEEDGRQGFSASYLSDGLLVFNSEFLPLEMVPANIRLQIDKAYNNYIIHNAYFINLYYPKREIYLVKLLDGAQMLYVFYDTYGMEINKDSLPPECYFL